MEKVLIFGVNGQMGAILANNLVGRDYNVIGIGRRKDNFKNLEGLRISKNFSLDVGDIRYPSCVDRLVLQYKPNIIFNFSAISDTQTCEDNKQGALQTNVEGVKNILHSVSKHSSDSIVITMGSTREFKNDRFYSTTKQMSRNLINYYYSQGIKCFQPYISLNDSEYRTDKKFVSAKIVQNLKVIKGAISQNRPFQPLQLGNIDQIKYWGYTRNFCHGLYRMAHDISLCSDKNSLNYYTNMAFLGNNHTVREFLELALNKLGFIWEKSNDEYWTDNGVIVKYDSSKFANDTDLNIDKKQFIQLNDYNRISFDYMVNRMVYSS